ncbi:CRISPR-associated helicase Cas3' [Saccharibacillus deserti]|uniref:CRISPR-associated helicase Cas3' n=1 Tax=Saccharibacillus deserti TaxID=1634444 RepID=UPI001552EC12|nr:CRISPR-associated helicase Cas3' [Saccharibacillus deserti]
MKYIAHIRQSDKEEQLLANHLIRVRDSAEQIGSRIGAAHIAGLAGLLHDLGKYAEAFQTYIREAVYSPDLAPKRGSVDHSTAGGKWLFDRFHDSAQPGRLILKLLSEVVGNAVISHHAYLHDFIGPNLESKYLQRVKEKEIPEYDRMPELFFAEVMSEVEFDHYVNRAAEELGSYMKTGKGSVDHKAMLLSKFIFSALIDADRTDARLFEENREGEQESAERKELFGLYHRRLLSRIDFFRAASDVVSPINALRQRMSEQCEAFAARPSGIYTLSIPTGGGKTLASLRYALKHAEQFDKKRIVYVVPYTTIIEQNAAEVRTILQDDANILEHHSNVAEQEKEAEDEYDEAGHSIRQKLRLAKDNWDSPIVFTTMVQFLNAFYAGGTRSIRRLHNLGEAVIVFDEVQKVPVSCVSLFNQAVNFLKQRGNSSILLCTATQPELGFVRNRLEVEPDAEIVPDLNEVARAFRRVNMVDRTKEGSMGTEALAQFTLEAAEEAKSVLVILNTRSVVKKLYRRLREIGPEEEVYHLSTNMCPAHRKDILAAVKNRLKQRLPVICVSTALIEAGVDISFRCVIRSLAGLDSIAQAAGRCNRHGEEAERPVYMIEHAEENLNYLREVRAGRTIIGKMLRDLRTDPSLYGGDLLSAAAMERYFREFYTEFQADLNYPVLKLDRNMTDLLSAGPKGKSYLMAYRSKHGAAAKYPLMLADSYGTAAEHFEAIHGTTTSVIVPYREGKQLIQRLTSEDSSVPTIAELTRLLREAQAYTINIREYEKENLKNRGWLIPGLENRVLVLAEAGYREEYGLELGQS